MTNLTGYGDKREKQVCPEQRDFYMSYFHRFGFSVKRCRVRGGWEIGGQPLHCGSRDSAVGGIHLFGPWRLGLNIVALSRPEQSIQIVFFLSVSAALTSAFALARTGAPFLKSIASYESHACCCCAIDVIELLWLERIRALNYGNHQCYTPFREKEPWCNHSTLNKTVVV